MVWPFAAGTWLSLLAVEFIKMGKSGRGAETQTRDQSGAKLGRRVVDRLSIQMFYYIYECSKLVRDGRVIRK